MMISDYNLLSFVGLIVSIILYFYPDVAMTLILLYSTQLLIAFIFYLHRRLLK